MLDCLIIVAWIIFILGFFYKQSAVHDFRINQANIPLRVNGGLKEREKGVEKEEGLDDLWKENIPLVIRRLPRLSLWTHRDIIERECYDRIPLFQAQTLRGWLQHTESDVVCPWQKRTDQAEALAKVSGISVWHRTHLRPLFSGVGAMRLLRYQAWAGRVGVRRTYASWTCILPTEEDIIVTIFPETMEPYLPIEWKGGFPGEWTRRDTPFAGDIKYMDVVVRAGTCFFLPPHWYMSWVSARGANGEESHGSIPMVFTILYHSPVSWMAEKMAG